MKKALKVFGYVVMVVLVVGFIGWILSGRYYIVDTWEASAELRESLLRESLLDVSSDKVTDEQP
ncbi:hypothetical protein LCGC14_2029600 [marine sediment metagenome]|uniref:Uncharacterized protein n=1 Tax=marine sediment metagenome TaxID=412755 RepID=A0A0F9FHM4_9ZZZZ